MAESKTETAFNPSAVLSAYTGILLGDFAEMQVYTEQVMGRAVWTHQLGSDEFRRALCAAIKERGDMDRAIRMLIAAPALLAALDNVLKQMDHDDAPWWIDSPDRGGFDREEIEAAIRQAKGEDDT